MDYSSRVLLDSISSKTQKRLTTLEVVFPRFILAEFNTHRAFSRNSASSRAIPTQKLLESVTTSPAMPLEWGKNQPGMSADQQITCEQQEDAETLWLHARDYAYSIAYSLAKLNVHKQTVNRILEPFLWHTIIVSATEWQNFFDLRCSPYAQPEMRHIACLMRKSIEDSCPMPKQEGEWHIPFLQKEEESLDVDIQKKLSIARCARVSYLTHEGLIDQEKDIALYGKLLAQKHMSPFEHVAVAMNQSKQYANFVGWQQERAFLT